MDGVNAMMGQALGLWRSAFRCAREGNGVAARQAGTAVADALWPTIPRTIEQAMKYISPRWRPSPIIPDHLISTRDVVFQVNGVRRANIPVSVDSAETGIEWVRNHHPDIFQQHIKGEVSRVVFVPGKIINVVVDPKAKPKLMG